MNIETIKKTMAEAKEFIKRAQDVIDENKRNDTYMLYGTAATSALRRQSMELTRSLTTMRKP